MSSRGPAGSWWVVLRAGKTIETVFPSERAMGTYSAPAEERNKIELEEMKNFMEENYGPGWHKFFTICLYMGGQKP